MCCCNEPEGPEFQFEMEDGMSVLRDTYERRDFDVVATEVTIAPFYGTTDIVKFVLRERDDAST